MEVNGFVSVLVSFISLVSTVFSSTVAISATFFQVLPFFNFFYSFFTGSSFFSAFSVVFLAVVFFTGSSFFSAFSAVFLAVVFFTGSSFFQLFQ
ncbi:hypothetical protein Bint_2622 [Brachyspira intermedia PWS/A]|uniref:Transmembrane protein n=2 Tax=Brachyspira intermedia TaxID=84377 RepID=G0EPF1_BRAIP|nr:hypothetical protein Bint_2622 [Brachyspira intermedia PWS/A]